MLLALSCTIAALTFIAEAIALGIEANVSPLRVLQAAFDFDTIRPGWFVLGAGLIMAALDFVCARLASPFGSPDLARGRGLTRVSSMSSGKRTVPKRTRTHQRSGVRPKKIGVTDGQRNGGER